MEAGQRAHTDCQEGKLLAADPTWHTPATELALSLGLMGTTWVPGMATGIN